MTMNKSSFVSIRQAELADLDSIMRIFDRARQFMISVGNPTQWGDGYPEVDLMIEEIKLNHCYVVLNESKLIVATFCYIEGDDPTYHVIESGKWLNNDSYAVLHRLASDGTVKGIGKLCLDWCFKHTTNLRVDTHKDNKVLQNILSDYGFTYCGIIYVRNHSPRLAYQRVVY